MNALPEKAVKLVFADPPYNINLNYDIYRDCLPADRYLKWSEDWIKACCRVLSDDGSMYVMVGDEYMAEVAVIMKRHLHWRNYICWHYTFGQNQRKKFARSHAHILYFVKSEKSFVWNLDAIRVPSARSERYRDKRAHPLGKVPDDVWGFSRVCGTFGERLKKEDGSAHPCQLPEALLGRIIKASSGEGDIVLDPFCGTGTTAAVSHKLGRSFITCDLSEMYCSLTASRIYNDPTRFERF